MNILFVIPRFPSPPLKGDQLIVYNRLIGLSKRFNITVVTFYENKDELADLKKIEQYCRSIIPIRLSKMKSFLNMLKGLFTNELPFQVNYYKSDKFFNQISRLIEKEDFKIVHVFTLRLAEYTKNLKVPVVYELIDSMQLNIENIIREEQYPIKFIYKLEQKRISKYEQELCSKMKFLSVVSEKDKHKMKCDHVQVIPNGVDLNQFEPGKFLNKGEIVFSGNMGYLPNIHAVKWFVKNCFPIIKQAVPNVMFKIIGANPSSYIKSLNNNDSIIVTGYVDSVADEIREAQVAVAPMRSGSGMQNKIIEAMACSVPVVTTHSGLEGLFAKIGSEILISDTPDTFAQSVINLLKDKNLHNTMSVNSRKYVEKYHSWEASNEKISNMYLDVYSEEIRKGEE